MNRMLIILLLIAPAATAQWAEKGQVLAEVGALPPFSINLKAGYAIRDNVVAGIFTEHQRIFTERNEIGIFGRKYMLNKRRVTFYLHGATSLGRYKPWSWGWEKFNREQTRADKSFNALKFIGGGGVNWRLSDRISLGHEATLGATNYKGHIFASSLFTFSYRLGSQP